MKQTILLFFSFLLLTGCAPTTIYSDFSQTTNFKQYTSFAWLPKTHSANDTAQFDNQILETNIKNLASGELKLRGYKIDTQTPDVLLDFYVSVAQKVDQVSTPVYSYPYNYVNYNYSNGYYNGIYYGGPNNYYNNYSYVNNATAPAVVGYSTQNVPYDEGTLTIIMIDRKTNQMIWKGWSVGTVTDEQSYEYELSSDIHRMFKEFPVPVPKNKK